MTDHNLMLVDDHEPEYAISANPNLVNDNELKSYNIILQNVLFNWDRIKSNPAFANILDPNKNAMIDKIRESDAEQSDKIIKAKCVAFTFYIVHCLSRSVK